jgi:tripeptidyl-peptidase-2
LAFSAPLRDEELSPAATLTTWRRALHPTTYTIAPCGARDVLPDGRALFQLVLEYAFEAPEDGTEVTFKAPLLQGLLYDAEFDSQFFLISDKDKKLVGFGDAFPDASKLKKGVHTVRWQVKHDDLKKLGGLKAMVVVAERKLKEPVAVPCFKDAGQASLGSSGGGAVAGSLVLGKGKATSVCFTAPPSDKLPAGVAPGDELTGTMTCVKKAQDRSRPNGWPVSFVVPPLVPKAKEAEATPEAAADKVKDSKEEESEAAKLDKQVLSLKVKALGAFDVASPPKDAAWAELFATLEASPSNKAHLPLAVAKMHHLDREDLRKANLAAVVAAADEVTALVNPTELSGALGLRAAEGDEAKRKELNEAKASLVDALARKARALLGLGSEAAAPEASCEAFKQALADLMRWEDAKAPANAKAMATVALGALKADGYGATLQYCKAALEKGDLGPSAEAEVKAARGAAMDALGWGWLSAHEMVWEGLNKPKTHALF